MNPEDCRFTKEHEWVYLSHGKKGKIGITKYAQAQLGDIVFVDLLPVESNVQQSQKIGEIESVKAVSEFYSPVSGQIVEINQAILDEPKLINEDCYGAGWFVILELSNPAELDSLLTSDEYDKFVADLLERKN